jgi:hypothetical protein
MTDVTILAVPLVVAAVLGAMRTVHWLRGRAMFALAARLGFRYVGRVLLPPGGGTRQMEEPARIFQVGFPMPIHAD